MSAPAAPGPGGAWLCAPGFEPALEAELRAAGLAAARAAGPGVVVHEGPAPAGLDPTFARQALPGAARVEAASAAGLAQAAFDALAGPLDVDAPWALHVAAADDAAADADAPRGRARYAGGGRGAARRGPGSGAARLAGRAGLVEAALLERFERLRRRTARRRVAGAALPAGGRLAQVVLVGRDAALASVAAPAALPTFGAWPDPRWPGGRPAVADDRDAPSSAYRKAEEAYLVLGAAPGPGETVVDLGGAPGGWTWTALRRGARAVLVDRAPPLPPVAGHPALEARVGDAFAFAPPAPVDWLLCDVAATPERTRALLERWLAGRWCRRLVVQTKLRGDEREGAVAALRDLLARHGARARTRHLTHDKNEVTTLGWAAP